MLANWDRLAGRTLAFVQAFCDSPLPEAVKEAALFNSSTLRTQTCFQTPDGHFFGWEGIHDDEGSCAGTCTHVWNYEQTTAFLFADHSRSMREVEFLHGTNDEGAMRFRTKLPLALNAADNGFLAAADGQMGCIMKIYRDWKLGGDDAILQLGKGCLIDQLVGQYMAHVCGLGYILDPAHVKTTLRSILKYDLKRGQATAIVNLHEGTPCALEPFCRSVPRTTSTAMSSSPVCLMRRVFGSCPAPAAVAASVLSMSASPMPRPRT